MSSDEFSDERHVGIRDQSTAILPRFLHGWQRSTRHDGNARAVSEISFVLALAAASARQSDVPPARRAHWDDTPVATITRRDATARPHHPYGRSGQPKKKSEDLGGASACSTRGEEQDRKPGSTGQPESLATFHGGQGHAVEQQGELSGVEFQDHRPALARGVSNVPASRRLNQIAKPSLSQYISLM